MQYLPKLPQEPLSIALIDPAEKDRLEAIEREVKAIADYLDGITDEAFEASAPLRVVERKVSRCLGLESRVPMLIERHR